MQYLLYSTYTILRMREKYNIEIEKLCALKNKC